MSDCTSMFRKMDYYIDRSEKDNFAKTAAQSAGTGFQDFADRCTKGDLVLWYSYSLHINDCEGNLFNYEFDSDVKLKREYLFAMDYLTYVLTAYKATGKEIYKTTFDVVQ